MSEIIAAMNGGGGHAQTTDHNFRRVLAGDIETVRERLIYALETLDYRVLSEQPLVARRRGRAVRCSFDVLRCVKSLTINLKSLNPTSTLVTFDYEILNSSVTKGDRQTVEREAEALIALATARPAAPVCASCGTHNSGDSRFCRVCGAPNALSDPAEIEVLRLTAGARPAHQIMTVGILSALLFAVVGMLLIFFSSKGPRAGLILLTAGEIFAAWSLFYGMWRLHRTLNPKKHAHAEAEPLQMNAPPHALSSAQTAALPPQSAHASVTEGTTELLPTPERERTPVPLKPQKVDTAEMES